MLAYPHDSVDGEPTVSGFWQSGRSFLRQILFGMLGTPVVSGVVGVWSQGKKVFSLLALDNTDWCQHTTH